VSFPPSVRAKLDRAQEHFDAIQTEIAAFDELNPYRTVHDHNADFTEHYLHLRLVEPFPGERWGCIFGDGVQNLRSALDHLVYAIAIRESGQDPPPEYRRLMFPVLDPPKPLPMSKIRTLSKPVQAAIVAEQPDSNRLDDSLLWQLDQLNVADKHRVIHVTLTQSDFGGYRIEGGTPKAPMKVTWNLRPLDGKAPLLRLTFESPQPNVKVSATGTGLIGVERIGIRKRVKAFRPIGNLANDLSAQVRAIIERVGRVGGVLDMRH
jgi:hypothetical protein